MGSMGKEPLPQLCTPDIFHLCLGWWFCHHRHLFAESAMSVRIIWSLVTPCIYYTFFFIVEPNGRTPYIGCYVTQYDPIVFLSWCLLLIYDKGAVVDY